MIRIYFKINDITTRSTTSNNNNNNIHGNSFKIRCIYRPIYLSIYLIQFALLLPFCNYCIGSIQVENKIVRGIEYFSRVSVRTLLQHKPVVIRIVVVLYFHFWKANPCAAHYHYWDWQDTTFWFYSKPPIHDVSFVFSLWSNSKITMNKCTYEFKLILVV